jgi:uncharacterized protein (DUF3820 family)
MSSAVPRQQIGMYLEITCGRTFVTFGKHKGESLEDVPEEYLRWALREITDGPEEFGKIVRDELHRRKHAGCLSFEFTEGEK